ncbi:MAG: hypothetical protein AAFV33_13580 [Chloroflexota bacterium]
MMDLMLWLMDVPWVKLTGIVTLLNVVLLLLPVVLEIVSNRFQ